MKKNITLKQLMEFVNEGIETYNMDKQRGLAGDLSEYIKDQIEDYLEEVYFESNIRSAINDITGNCNTDILCEEDKEKFLKVTLKGALERQDAIRDEWDDFCS